ncbi:hypothetical protein QCA50_003223 [Cerrena zonata]|uniref:ARM repeat superfamily protein n=1 Tax=Cerrena zonata TaxID=2478898 RepID=A0AAW0GVT5_9APHY
MLGTLLLSTNALVGGPTRFAVVELLKRVRQAEENEALEQQSSDASLTQQDTPPAKPLSVSSPSQTSGSDSNDDDDESTHYTTGLLGEVERRLFEREMIQQVIIGMGRLDIELAEELNGADVEDSLHNEVDMSTSNSFWSHLEATPRATEPSDSYFPIVPPVAEPQTTPQSAPLEYHLASLPATSTSLPLPLASSSITEPLASADTHTASDLMSPSLELSRPPGFSPPATQLSLSPSASPFLPSSPDSTFTPSLTSASTSSSPSTNVSPETLPTLTSSPSYPSSSSDEPPTENHVGIVEHAAYTWPRSPGDLPPVSDEERRQWERQFVPTNFTLHPGMGLSDPSSSVHPSMSGVTSWGTDLHSLEENPENPIHEEEHDLSEEAAVGRLSSMSLMAAVTASGVLAEDTKTAFVSEVERVGRDSVYWVRREASFTVGALAKVVPVEVVKLQLLPLFKLLCEDSFWQVRHSALFALPNVLSRLDSEEKRQLALDVILPLSKDESSTVRSGVLEALAEVMYTFFGDEGGPPTELLRLFLGLREGETERRPYEPPQQDWESRTTLTWSDFVAAVTQPTPELDIYDDPTRPLVCAFNFPAVALTLGPERWHELRTFYLELSLNQSLKVRTTLAASLGELAKIIGPQQAKEDLMGVWWSSVRAQESEVRLKAVGCLAMFVGHVSGESRRDVFGGIVSELWDGKFRNWREREGVMKHMPTFISTAAVQEEVLLNLFTKGLEDSVSAVREAAISLIPVFISEWAPWPRWVDRVFEVFKPMATSGAYRKRILYVACQQEVFVSGNHQLLVENDEFWDAMQVLASDSIVDVRIRVARLLGLLSDNVQEPSDRVKGNLRSLAEKLSDDTSHDVQAFAKVILADLHPIILPRKDSGSVIKSASNFSRPPPPSG